VSRRHPPSLFGRRRLAEGDKLRWTKKLPSFAKASEDEGRRQKAKGRRGKGEKRRRGEGEKGRRGYGSMGSQH